MGADAPMLRSRRKPGRCPVPGHDDTCEMAAERRQRDRRDDQREVRAVLDELAPREPTDDGGR